MSRNPYLPPYQTAQRKPAPLPRRPRAGIVATLARLALMSWALLTLAAGVWVLLQNPLAHLFTERSTEEIRAALTRAEAKLVTPSWLSARIEEAVDAGNSDRTALLLSVAHDRDIPLSSALNGRAQALIARGSDPMATARSCARCMVDVRACPSLALVGACTIPFQLSPLGDVQALGTEGMNWLSGQPVDALDASLAGIGLAATLATLPTAGSALAVKAGASMLRIAHRADALSPGLRRSLSAATREAGGSARLGTMADDALKIVRATSPAEALPLLRLADNGDDLSRIARTAEAAGPETRATFELLGKGRVLRLTHRLSTLTMAGFAVVMSLIGQIGAVIGTVIKLFLRRLAR